MVIFSHENEAYLERVCVMIGVSGVLFECVVPSCVPGVLFVEVDFLPPFVDRS